MTFSQCGGSDDVVIRCGREPVCFSRVGEEHFFRLIFLIFLFLYIFVIELQIESDAELVKSRVGIKFSYLCEYNSTAKIE